MRKSRTNIKRIKRTRFSRMTRSQATKSLVRCAKLKLGLVQKLTTNKKEDFNPTTIVKKMETMMKKATKMVSIKMKMKTKKVTTISDIYWFI